MFQKVTILDITHINYKKVIHLNTKKVFPLLRMYKFGSGASLLNLILVK